MFIDFDDHHAISMDIIKGVHEVPKHYDEASKTDFADVTYLIDGEGKTFLIIRGLHKKRIMEALESNGTGVVKLVKHRS